MRLELAGQITGDPSPTFESFEEPGSHDFDPDYYLARGFTDYDVICIGGGGGRGGGVDTGNTGTLWRTYGGEGGGGGYHRVQGKLTGLPSPCPVVVGAAGAVGVEHVSDPTAATDGTDGTYSTFNGTLCCASGGVHGKRAFATTLANIATAPPGADGGQGGIGNRTAVGGGAAGGHCGDPDDDTNLPTDGMDGPITDNIGWGGGGGAGGVSKYGTEDAFLEATAGGAGSYNPDDTLVAGTGEDPQTGGADVESSKPGRGSGAKASPLNNGLAYEYGRAGAPGVVVVRLIAR